MNGLIKNNIAIDRKILSELAITIHQPLRKSYKLQ